MDLTEDQYKMTGIALGCGTGEPTSNAPLQWSGNHQNLFLKIISKVNKAGQLVVQMPYQSENNLIKSFLTWRKNKITNPSSILESQIGGFKH